MTTIHRVRIPVGNGVLYIPFYVNVRELAPEQIEGLMDMAESALGATHFRERDLTLEVLHDQVQETKKPLTWLHGPYVKVWAKDEETIRLSTTQAVSQDEGGTVYDYEQAMSLMQAINAPVPAHRSRMRK